MHAAALAEDAAIFDYDSHYDTIQEVRWLQGRAEWDSSLSARGGGARPSEGLAVKAAADALGAPKEMDPPPCWCCLQHGTRSFLRTPSCRLGRSPSARRSCSGSRATSPACWVRWYTPRLVLARLLPASACPKPCVLPAAPRPGTLSILLSARWAVPWPGAAEKAEERKKESDIQSERQLAKERAAGGWHSSARRCLLTWVAEGRWPPHSREASRRGTATLRAPACLLALPGCPSPARCVSPCPAS